MTNQSFDRNQFNLDEGQSPRRRNRRGPRWGAIIITLVLVVVVCGGGVVGVNFLLDDPLDLSRYYSQQPVVEEPAVVVDTAAEESAQVQAAEEEAAAKAAEEEAARKAEEEAAAQAAAAAATQQAEEEAARKAEEEAAAQTAAEAAANEEVVEEAPTHTPVPTQDTRVEINVAFPSFGSYFTMLQAAQMPDLPVIIDVFPIDFDESGNFAMNEEQQAQALCDGRIDMLLTTRDALSRNEYCGVIAAITDQSAGADVGAAWDIAPSDGTPTKPMNSDVVRGKTIATIEGGPGHFQAIGVLRLIGLTVDDVNWLFRDTAAELVEDFLAGKADYIFTWQPDVQVVLETPGVTELVSSDWWRSIWDVIVVSHDADQNKREAVLEVLRYWFIALNIQQTDFNAAAESIASWTYYGTPSNDWTWVACDDPEFCFGPYDDFEFWLLTIAQASLESNVALMQNRGFIEGEIIKDWTTWSTAGISTLAQINPSEMIEPWYVFELSKDTTLYSVGEFVNPTFNPYAPELPVADPTVLVDLPTLAELPCKDFAFIQNTWTLTAESEADLEVCTKALREMTAVSDLQILIEGWTAWPEADPPYTEEYLKGFAQNRAAAVMQYLVDELGVDPRRITINGNVPTIPEHQNTIYEEFRAPYRIAIITVKRAGFK